MLRPALPRRLALCLLTLLTIAPEVRGQTAVPAAAASTQVKFTYWNIQWFPGKRPEAQAVARERHVAAVIPVVQRLNPDVLGMEEIADAEAAHLLADKLPGGFRVDVVTEYVREGGEPTRQQTVLASRLPLINCWWESWKPAADGLMPRRGFAFAAYQPAPGQVLLVYGLHLKSNRVDEPGGEKVNAAMRVESVKQLVVHARAMAAAYAKMGAVTVVLGGDLNTSLDDPRFASEGTLKELLKDNYQWAFQNVPPAARVTLPGGGRYPDTTFDHVFFRGFEPTPNPGLIGVGVEPTGLDCSDHRPVSVTLELKKG